MSPAGITKQGAVENFSCFTFNPADDMHTGNESGKLFYYK